MVSDEQLQEWARLADEATPGPWANRAGWNLVTAPEADVASTHVDRAANAAFIAASRTAVPALIAEVRRLREVEESHDLLTFRLSHPGATTVAADWTCWHQHERDEARDCGQEGVCTIAPGCQRHWEERCREVVQERDEARAEVDRLRGRLAIVEGMLDAYTGL